MLATGPSLSDLVGSTLLLRPVDDPGHGAGGISSSVGSAPHVVEAVAVGATSSALRLETDDPRVTDLHNQTVVAQRPGDNALIRTVGRLDVLGNDRPYVLILRQGPEGRPVETLQRRDWLRIRTSLDALVTIEDASGDRETSFGTTTVDLGGGGVRLSSSGDLVQGDVVHLEIELPGGALEAEADVLAVSADGEARCRFRPLPEAACSRITRYLFDLQMEHRRRARNAPPT
ncbi:MAG: flagellar brake protein [Acidimicrobiales bacterium]